MIILMLMTGMVLTTQTNAQQREMQEIKTTTSERAAVKQKTTLSNPRLQNNMTQGKAAKGAGFSDIKLAENEKKAYIIAYKMDFVPSTSVESPKTSILLYSSRSKQAGVINFYEKNAKALKEDKVVGKDDFLTFNYDIAMLPYLQSFIEMTDKIVVVYNTKDKSAYLSSDALSTR